MTLETGYGVPTVAVHTDKFDAVVRSVAQVSGMPGLRQVFVPQPIMGKTRHKNPRTAMCYVKPGAEAIAKITEVLAPRCRTH